MRKRLVIILLMLLPVGYLSARVVQQPESNFEIRGFHLDLRVQIMTVQALKNFARELSRLGINTLIMEYEATYPFEKHPLISNRYKYTKAEITDLVGFCRQIGIDVIPLQQSFGHVEYILRHSRYMALRESQKDLSQVCPSEEALNKALFTDLFKELASTHPSKYFHIGGDETRLLGVCPKCKAKAAKEGISKLYIDQIRLLCDIVIGMGKRPVLWADIALKYPEALKLLPKETVFVDWNYGWDLNKFGDHARLMESGFEIWGAPSLRSSPDNYYLSTWGKHFDNIRDFVPAARKLGYKGMIMTSWSTSGVYSYLYESASDIIDLHAVRRVYPITGFNMLIEAYAESLRSPAPLNITAFIQTYCRNKYGFQEEQSDRFWKALKAAPHTVSGGKVARSSGLSMKQLLDSAVWAARELHSLKPVKNKTEFAHYLLMADIREQYLAYQYLEEQVNLESFTTEQVPAMLTRLRKVVAETEDLRKRFTKLNKGSFYISELELENHLREIKAKNLYERLAGAR